MFTGIVEEVGVLRAVRRGAHSAELSISAQAVLADLKTGDSVAVNGVCLTATSVGPDHFTADTTIESIVPKFEENFEYLSVLFGERGDFSFFLRVRKALKDVFYRTATLNGMEVSFALNMEIEFHVAGTTAALLAWLRTPARPSAEEFIAAIRAANSHSTDTLLGKIRPAI